MGRNEKGKEKREEGRVKDRDGSKKWERFAHEKVTLSCKQKKYISKR
jgi:hypothetical protein